MLKIGTAQKFEGLFWVGDPCYVFPDERWNEFCELLFKTEGPTFMEEDGETFFVDTTAYGDGRYPIENNLIRIGSCGVDAGLLSLIPVSLIKKWGDMNEAARLGVFTNVSGVPAGDGSGDWTCGALKVCTGGSLSKEEED